MKLFKSLLPLLLLAIIAMPITHQTSFAADAEVFLEKLQEEVDKNGHSITVGKIEDVSDTVTIVRDLVFKDSKTKQTITVEQLTAEDLIYPELADRTNVLWPLEFSNAEFENIRIEKSGEVDGTIEIPSVTISGLRSFGSSGFALDAFDISTIDFQSKSENGDVVSGNIAGMSGENFFSPDLGNEDASIIPEKDMRVQIGSAIFNLNGEAIAGWESGRGSNIGKNNNTVIASEGEFKGAFVDLTKIPITRENKKGLETVAELGYEKLTGSISAQGSWDLVSGLISLNSYRLDFEEIGSLDLSLRFAGYTEQVARQISKLASEANGQEDAKKRQAISMQMLGAMAGLSFEELVMSVEDKSAVDRIVDYQAKKSNLDKQSVTSIVPVLATTVLGPFNVPQLANQTRDALSVFMQGNKSITLSAKPGEPIPFAQLFALAAGVQAGGVQPSELVERLNLQIEAQ